MIEKQKINGKAVWIKIDAQPANRENPNTIPTEYFTVTCYDNEPANGNGKAVTDDENGAVKLFESPVAALTFARKSLENGLTKQQQTQLTQQEQKETD